MSYNPMSELLAMSAHLFVEKDSISKTLEKEPHLSCNGCTYEIDCPSHQKCHRCARMYRDNYFPIKES